MAAPELQQLLSQNTNLFGEEATQCPCQLDATSTGVQFLTLDAVREAARCYIVQRRAEILRVKEATDDEEQSLRQLEARVTDVIKCKTDSRQMNKYRQYVDEMERATRLLLLLAGRLARIDNSALAPSADSQPITPKSSAVNRDELMEKFSDASSLKSDVDRRGRLISDQLACRLTADELADYERLMAAKTRVRLQRQEIDDWLRLADQQLSELSVNVDERVQDLISHC